MGHKLEPVWLADDLYLITNIKNIRNLPEKSTDISDTNTEYVGAAFFLPGHNLQSQGEVAISLGYKHSGQAASLSLLPVCVY